MEMRKSQKSLMGHKEEIQEIKLEEDLDSPKIKSPGKKLKVKPKLIKTEVKHVTEPPEF